MNSNIVMKDVFFSIGSNINPEKNIKFAKDQLKKTFTYLEYSSIYKTEAVGFQGNYFLNLVAKAQTKLSPKIIMETVKEIEIATGRKVGSGQFNSRTLDIDMILYGDLVDIEIRIPRDDIDLYAFVIEPLSEINPEGIHPVSGYKYCDLWKNFDKKNQKTEKIFL